jgi:hypothetical protein
MNNALGVYGSPYSPHSQNNIFNRDGIAPIQRMAPIGETGC